MSRSRKKNPYYGNCADSDKRSKRHASKKHRRRIKALIDAGADQDELPKHKYESDHAWNFDKDGKSRFDANARPELLRK